MTRALFLDRDGTLVEDGHHTCDPARVRLIPGVREALRTLREAGWLLFVLTNQSGIGRGYFSWADYEACNARMLELLDLGPDVFVEIKAAPEKPGEPSVYRKPSPAFIVEMLLKHGLDALSCWMAGDRRSDWECGLNAGICPAALRSGKALNLSSRRFLQRNRVPCFSDFPAFARWLALERKPDMPGARGHRPPSPLSPSRPWRPPAGN